MAIPVRSVRRRIIGSNVRASIFLAVLPLSIEIVVLDRCVAVLVHCSSRKKE